MIICLLGNTVINLETKINLRNITINMETSLLAWKLRIIWILTCFQVEGDFSKIKVMFPSSKRCFQVSKKVWLHSRIKILKKLHS